MKGQYGTCVHYDAQVYQFDTVTGNKNMLVAITNEGYGVWDDLVWLNLATPSLGASIYDNNIVYLVGRLEGTYSYTTTLGSTNTVPAIDVTQLRLASSRPKANGPKPAILTFTALPAHLPAKGGTVVLSATVRNATACRFIGQLTRQVSCAGGKVRVLDTVKPNVTTATRVLHVSLVAQGKGGTVSRSLTVTEAAQPKPTTTTSSRPTTTQPTTTTSAQPSNICTGPCKFSFPVADTDGFASVALNSLTQGVSCPDPGACDATGSQQIDDTNVTMCAGPSGAPNGTDPSNFSLALSDGTQASQDSVTFDSNVPTALGNYGAIAPGQCVTGDIYFDATSGTQWTSLNFAYTAADFSSQLVYVWRG
jgi:hypothetical protein